MSFGFSPGDIVLFLGFAAKVFKALRDEGGSRSEYHLAEQQCKGFLSVMRDVQQFDLSNVPQLSRSKIEEHLTHSRELVNDFKQTIEKYEKAMGKNSRRGVLTSAPRKIQWAISAADNLDKFRQSLSAQLSIVQLTISKAILSIVAGSNQRQNLLPGPAHSNALSKAHYHSSQEQRSLDWDYSQINAPDILQRIDDIADLVYERILSRPRLHLGNHGRIHTLSDDADASIRAQLDVIPESRRLTSTHHLDEPPVLNQSENGWVNSGDETSLTREINGYLHSLNLEELTEQEAEQVNWVRNKSERLLLDGASDSSSETLPQEHMNSRGPSAPSDSGIKRRHKSKFGPFEFGLNPMSGVSLAIKIMQVLDSSARLSLAVMNKENGSQELAMLAKRIMQYSTLLELASSIIRMSMRAEQQKLAWEIVQDSQVTMEKVGDILNHITYRKMTRSQIGRSIWQFWMWRARKQEILSVMGELESLKSTLSVLLQTHQLQISERNFQEIKVNRKRQADFQHSMLHFQRKEHIERCM